MATEQVNEPHPTRSERVGYKARFLSLIEKHAVFLLLLFFGITVIYGGLNGFFSHPLEKEDYRWKLEMYFQGSLVILGLLMIFAFNYNRWLRESKNWEIIAGALNKDSKELRRSGPIKLMAYIRSMDFDKFPDDERHCLRMMISWVIFSMAILIFIAVSVLSLIYIGSYGQVSYADPRTPGAIAGAMGAMFTIGMTFLIVFVMGYTLGAFTSED